MGCRPSTSALPSETVADAPARACAGSCYGATCRPVTPEVFPDIKDTHAGRATRGLCLSLRGSRPGGLLFSPTSSSSTRLPTHYRATLKARL